MMTHYRLILLLVVICIIAKTLALDTTVAAGEEEDNIPTAIGETFNGASTTTSSSGFLESLWEKLRKQIMEDQQHEATQSHIANKQTATQKSRRRALYEHTLDSHYASYLPHEEKETSTEEEEEETTTIQADFTRETANGCLWYNEGGGSFWTYRWCPNTSLSQLHLQQQQQNEEWVPQFAYNLGRLEKPIDQDLHQTSWKRLLRLVSRTHDDDDAQEMQLFSGGDVCGNNVALSKKQKQKQRRGLVVMRECGDVKMITKVEEPFACDYIVHVCYPNEEKTENKDGDNVSSSAETLEDSEAASSAEDSDELKESTALEDSEDGHMEANDTTETETVKETEQTRDVSQQEEEEMKKEEMKKIRDIQRVMKQYLHKSSTGSMNEEDRTTPLYIGLAPFPPSRQEANLELVREMFRHAYDSYMYNAFPASEIKPLSCKPGTFHLVRLPALTLIDTLDTLVVMQNFTEFARSVERLKELDDAILDGDGLFAVNQNVSVFETNIRVLGGLLSAHQLAVAYLDTKVLERDVWDTAGNVKIGGPADDAANENEESSSPNEEPHSDLYNTCPLRKPVCDNIGFTESGLVDFESQAFEITKDQCSNNTTQLKSRPPIKYWQYDGVLLQLARDLGERLLPAFQTKTGIPYGTVNLLHGIPPGETTIASLAGGGTLTLEMELLSRMTGDETFGKAAKLASRALWMRRSPHLNLLGKHIDIHRGEWTETLSGIGSNSDSFYEYLIKHYILFPEDDDFWTMLVSVYNGVHNDTRLGEWYADVDMNLGVKTGARRVFESLMAFYPGMQVLLGELSPAARTLNSFFMVREYLGFLPERFNYGQWQVDGSGAGHHPLRPELLESCYFVHRATSGLGGMPRGNDNNSSAATGWLWAADFALHALQDLTYAKCGYATVKDLSPTTTGLFPRDSSSSHRIRLVDEMPSFFLSETLKYLYLVFDDDNILHTDTEREWVFTTEAHPIHHVGAGSEDKPSNKDGEYEWLEGMKDKLENRLQQRLAKKRELVEIRRPVISAALNSNKEMQEKWAEKSPSSVYADHLTLTEKDTVKRKQDRDQLKTEEVSDGKVLIPTKFKQPFLGPLHPAVGYDAFDEENLVYLAFEHHGLGNGASLMKSCPNFHNSGLLWVRALNGGAIDYSEVYVSTASNEETSTIAEELSNEWLMSGLEATAHFGTGLYLGIPSDGSEPTCKLALSKDSKASKGAQKSTGSSHGVERVDVGALGQFDIAVFDGGAGFYARRVGMDEAVTATFYSEEEDGSSNGRKEFVMVYLQTPVASSTTKDGDLAAELKPPSSWRSSWRSIFKRNGKNKEKKEQKFHRSVVFTNANSDAFVCTVSIVKKILLRDKVESEEEDLFIENEELLAEYPCAPALFGPTQIHELMETGGLEVEAEIIPPDSSDPHGCKEAYTKDESNGESTADGGMIQMVRRGKCTFQEKATKQRRHAEGVIVMNNLNADLFLMSKGSDELESLEDLPPTVLVVGHDGKEMQSLIKQHSVPLQSMENGYMRESIIGRIQLTPQQASLENGQVVSETGAIDWPLVISNPGQIQVFAPSGWGVQAIDTGSMIKAGNSRWQLFLLNHNIN